MRYTITALIVLWASASWAQVRIHPFGSPQGPAAAPGPGSVRFLQQGSAEAPAVRSGKVAALLSIALPGAGELYLGAPKRAAAFLSLEAITWLSYFRWRSKGNDLKADFRVYADQHWNEARYRAWQVYNASEGYPFNETETLPDRETGDTQQYYEMIGKYDQFVFGWDDVADVPFTVINDQVESPRRLDYEGQRNESNKFLKRASFVIGFSVLNRIGSAIHASVYARNQERDRRSVRLWVRLHPMDERGAPAATLGASF
jgi:hypothetical protein